jgi:hypothetical protein
MGISSNSPSLSTLCGKQKVEVSSEWAEKTPTTWRFRARNSFSYYELPFAKANTFANWGGSGLMLLKLNIHSKTAPIKTDFFNSLLGL